MIYFTLFGTYMQAWSEYKVDLFWEFQVILRKLELHFFLELLGFCQTFFRFFYFFHFHLFSHLEWTQVTWRSKKKNIIIISSTKSFQNPFDILKSQIEKHKCTVKKYKD